MAQAKAKALGFHGGSLRHPGSVFDIKGGETGEWFEVISEEEAKQIKPKAQAAKGKGPQTFSEIAKQDSKALAPKGVEDLV